MLLRNILCDQSLSPEQSAAGNTRKHQSWLNQAIQILREKEIQIGQKPNAMGQIEKSANQTASHLGQEL